MEERCGVGSGQGCSPDACSNSGCGHGCGSGKKGSGCSCDPDFSSEGCGHSSKEWASGFVPRESREPVRNCSQVNRDVSKLIVDTIAGHLLTTECLVTVKGGEGGGGGETPTHSTSTWNQGGARAS